MIPDWSHIEATVLGRFEEGLSGVQQSPKHHAEGDAYVHTLMVCDALKFLPEFQELNELQQHILYMAALLHDIGKIPTTVFVDGDWHTPHHAPTGSRMARELLWKEYGLCGKKELMEIREAICLLIRYHSYPPVAIERDHPQLQLHRMATNSLLVPEFSLKMLCMLCKADMLGRKCNDQQEVLEKIAMCEELAKEEGAESMVIAAKTEEDIAELESYEDKQLFLEELGLEESGVNRLIKKAYALLNLETFITAGEMEVKAWTYKKGWKAPQCAGVIHTDFEKGFIRAEVIKYDDYIQYGSEAAVREAGK